MQEGTIAHYRKWKVWARMILIVALLASIPFITIWGMHKEQTMTRPHFAEDYQLAMAWIFGLLTLGALISTFRQVVFHQDRLIWIENGQVVWHDPTHFTVPCADIVKVTPGVGGKYFWYDNITFLMRDGSEKVIETDSLQESCDEVVHRLREALGLKITDGGPALFRV
jgi:hypothetical protein